MMADQQLEALEREERRLYIECYNAQVAFEKAKEAFLTKKEEWELAHHRRHGYKRDRGDYDLKTTVPTDTDTVTGPHT